MSQSTTSKKFPIQQVGKLVSKVNDGIEEILSNSAVGFESISTLSIEVENIVAILFDSVLEGEFVRNSKIKDDVQEFKNSLPSSLDLEERIQGVSDQSIRSFISEIRENIYLIENIIEEYIGFINGFEFLVNEDKDYIFSISQNKRGITKTEEYNLFLVNLELCILDIQLSESSRYASTIEQIKSYIGEGGYLAKQKEKMFKKANFLLFKWYKRAEVNKKNISSIVDGEEKGNYEEEVVGYGEEWENVVDYINNHYFEGRERELKKSFRQIKDKEYTFIYQIP